MSRLCTLLLVLFLTGCSSVGPETIPGDQFDYNAAITESTQQQLLAAMVRLRYSETPTFLKVSSMISQYQRSASVNATGGINTGLTGNDTATAGGRATWSDRPTITYVPISGSEFARNLLKPLPPEALFSLIQAGWPADLVMELAIWSINGLNNSIARPSRRRQSSEEFYELFEVWGQLRKDNAIGQSHQSGKPDAVTISLVFNPAMSAESRVRAERFRELLGPDAEANEFSIAYGLFPENSRQLAVLTGSVWDIMLNMAWQFEVPQSHIVEGRTGDTFQSSYRDGIAPVELMFSREQPVDAFVSVYAHDHWFYIDNTDRASKRAFSFLQILINLAETSAPENVPAITIGN